MTAWAFDGKALRLYLDLLASSLITTEHGTMRAFDTHVDGFE